jgi:hypothetical protein
MLLTMLMCLMMMMMRAKSWVLIVERFWTLNTDFSCSLLIILFCNVECEIVDYY